MEEAPRDVSNILAMGVAQFSKQTTQTNQNITQALQIF